MAEPYFSPNWYRVANLRPRLRNHVGIRRHVVRGDVWYVLQDDQTGGHFRVSPAAYRFLAGLDGRRTVAELWEAVARRVGDDHLSQEEVIRFLAQLHWSDMLAGRDLPDLGELVARGESRARRKLMSRVQNPLAIRIPLLDPDRFLGRALPLVAWLFTPAGFALWLVLVGYGLTLAAIHWQGLTHNIADRVISFDTVLFFLVLYPAMKALHELGHGLAVKAWGGEVHEMGVMFLVFMPVPYVDASAASGFRRRRRRAVVGAVGIMVELGLAALAMIVWSLAEPGLVRAAAFNVMLIGGASTLLFNGNPLLRFDGYYVLCDLLDIPNLGSRANRYLQYLVQRYAFGRQDAENPATAPGERFWFVGYGVLSFVYRLAIMVGISLFVATRFFFVGVLLALVALFMTMVLPLWKGLRFVFLSSRLGERQGRAKAVTALSLGAAAAALFLVPAPYATVSQGVVWPPKEGRVVATASGFVDRIHVENGATVAPAQPLIALADPQVDAQIAILEAEAAEYAARHQSVVARNPGQAAIVAEQLERTRAALAFWQERRRRHAISARQGGEVALPEADLQEGQLVAEGALLGYVLGETPRVLRVLVPQERINDVRRDTRGLSVRFLSALDTELGGRIEHVTPAAVDALPSRVLGPEGGGAVLVDPEPGAEAPKPLHNHYAVEVRVEEPAGPWRAEERALVRFAHSPTPLGVQLLRAVREVFLRQFSV